MPEKALIAVAVLLVQMLVWKRRRLSKLVGIALIAWCFAYFIAETPW